MTLATPVVTVPLNLIIYGGKTNNIRGNGVIARLTEIGVPFVPSCIIGEFYVDFLDN